MSIAVKSGLPSLGSTEGAVITKDDISVTEETSPSASAGEDLPRGKSAYEVAVENGFSGTETEWLASLKGATGAPGADGKNGENGKTPYVGDNGNWFVGSDDTGKPSRGEKGEKGDTGAQGIQGEQGIQGVQGEKGDKGEKGAQGPQGLQGPPGEAGADGKTPNITIGSVTTLEAGQNATASMGGTAESPVLNLGIPKGADGQPGTDGKTAYQYAQDGGYTGTETEFAAKLAQEIPEALPNPNALTFTGAVNTTYDGSTAVSVEIPSGGGADISLGLTSAAVGQIIKVKAIDESGKPTAWEAANMPSGGNASTENWKLIRKITVPDDPTTDGSGMTWIVDNTGAVTGVEFDTDENGSAFNCSELSITGVGICAADGRLDYYAGDTLLCSYNGQQVGAKQRYSWVWLRRLGAVWQAVGNTVAAWRFIYDMQQLLCSGFFTGPETTLNSVTKLSLRGTKAYNAGYVFEIWGR